MNRNKMQYSIIILVCLITLGGCGSKDSSPPTLILSVPSVEIEQDQEFNPLQYAKATDDVDGDLTSKIVVKSNTVKTDVPGTYSVVFEVKDSDKNTIQSSLIVTVLENYTESEKAVIAAVNALKNALKDPSSLQIYSLYAYKWPSYGYAYTIKIDYSAMNGFGGVNRKTYYINVKSGGAIDANEFSEDVQSTNSIRWRSSSAEEINVEKVMKGVN